MKIGVVYPQTEYGNDPVAIHDYAQTAEELGYSHIVAYDHVLGANPDRPGGWRGPYTYQTPFQEPFVLFSYMAAITQKIGFFPGILILPQRQTALVAKQAACLDVLSNGRLRLGVGIGWNEVEYISLNENFRNRGRRVEEQLEVLRLLWTMPLVTYTGRWHTIPDAGLNPLPVQRPIPIWFGGTVDAALHRMARIGDGWVTNYRTATEARPALDLIERTLEEAGRLRESFGFEARLAYGNGDPETWSTLVKDWQTLGVSHLEINTMGSGFRTPAEHLSALRAFAKAVGLQ
jgi:probable F420-dependent oxidoreductase